MSLTKPTLSHVRHRLEKYGDDPRFYGADPAVRLVVDQWPKNSNYHEILVKVVVLNQLYSTRIINVYSVVNHIEELKIDQRLAAGDLTLVEDLATVRFKKTTRHLYSFATKYCAWHNSQTFQIYDSYVDWILWEYRKAYEFAAFHRYELRLYPRFINTIEAFRSFFGLEELSRKHVDKFLWIEASLS